MKLPLGIGTVLPMLNVLADSLTTLGLGLDSSLNPNFRKSIAADEIADSLERTP